MVRKKRVSKKKVSVSHRSQAKLHKDNRENFGMATPVAEAYQIIHDAINILKSGEQQVHKPEELIRCFFLMYNYIPDEKDGVNNFEALSSGISFPEQLDNLTGLLVGYEVESKDRKEALNSAIAEVSKYYPIKRRSEVKEETAKSRTSKKKVTAKAASKKKVVAKKAATQKDEAPKRRGRKAAGFVTFSGSNVDINSVEEKVLSENGIDWEAFDEKLKKGKVKPSTTVGYKDNESNVFANIVKAIGGNRGKSVAAKSVVQFVVDNVEVTEKVAKSKLYKLINNGQLDVV